MPTYVFGWLIIDSQMTNKPSFFEDKFRHTWECMFNVWYVLIPNIEFHSMFNVWYVLISNTEFHSMFSVWYVLIPNTEFHSHRLKQKHGRLN